GSGPGELCRVARFECRDHFVLPCSLEPNEGLVIGFAAIRIELSKAAPVEILKIGVCAGERQINVIEHPRVACARLAGRTRHETFSECRDCRSIVVIEERAMPLAGRMRLSWRSILPLGRGWLLHTC